MSRLLSSNVRGWCHFKQPSTTSSQTASLLWKKRKSKNYYYLDVLIRHHGHAELLPSVSRKPINTESHPLVNRIETRGRIEMEWWTKVAQCLSWHRICHQFHAKVGPKQHLTETPVPAESSDNRKDKDSLCYGLRVEHRPCPTYETKDPLGENRKISRSVQKDYPII